MKLPLSDRKCQVKNVAVLCPSFSLQTNLKKIYSFDISAKLGCFDKNEFDLSVLGKKETITIPGSALQSTKLIF